MYYVDQVPDQYVVTKWCKGIKDSQLNVLEKSRGDKHLLCSSMWKMQMKRKMNSVTTACEQNKNVRAKCEKYFNELKELVELNVRSVYCEGVIMLEIRIVGNMY